MEPPHAEYLSICRQTGQDTASIQSINGNLFHVNQGKARNLKTFFDTSNKVAPDARASQLAQREH